MRDLINIYCDESCHLKNDGESVMVLGAVSCPESKKSEIFQRISEIKKKYDLIPKNKKWPKENRSYYEIKWNKVSMAKIEFYKEIIDYFFDDDDLCFRVLVVPDKSKIDYVRYNHTHDTFYYKMYFNMLKVILNQIGSYPTDMQFLAEDLGITLVLSFLMGGTPPYYKLSK
jgi:hypothetical protein